MRVSRFITSLEPRRCGGIVGVQRIAEQLSVCFDHFVDAHDVVVHILEIHT